MNCPAIPTSAAAGGAVDCAVPEGGEAATTTTMALFGFYHPPQHHHQQQQQQHHHIPLQQPPHHYGSGGGGASFDVPALADYGCVPSSPFVPVPYPFASGHNHHASSAHHHPQPQQQLVEAQQFASSASIYHPRGASYSARSKCDGSANFMPFGAYSVGVPSSSSVTEWRGADLYLRVGATIEVGATATNQTLGGWYASGNAPLQHHHHHHHQQQHPSFSNSSSVAASFLFTPPNQPQQQHQHYFPSRAVQPPAPNVPSPDECPGGIALHQKFGHQSPMPKSTKKRLKHRMERHAAASARSAPYSCASCTRQYCRKSTLRAHVKQHHAGERPFICQTCGKHFSQAANLAAHRRVHTGEKPFCCSVCHRNFSQSSSLVTHKRTHTGERPYPCPHCEKAFTDSSTLTKHLRTHTGQKPYACALCLMQFSQSGNLHRHMKTHMSRDFCVGSAKFTISRFLCRPQLLIFASSALQIIAPAPLFHGRGRSGGGNGKHGRRIARDIEFLPILDDPKFRHGAITLETILDLHKGVMDADGQNEAADQLRTCNVSVGRHYAIDHTQVKAKMLTFVQWLNEMLESGQLGAGEIAARAQHRLVYSSVS
uniref:C2H2-type domain-containing protein n=1 Tax=Globodera rostochiensis TaxID=31243 RepID=A0A914IBE9_GLORO